MSKNARTVGILLVISVLLLGAGLIVGGSGIFMPGQASAEAKATDALFNVMMVIGTIIFLIVEGVLVYSIVRFRKPNGDETDAAPIHGNTALEITWTAIPTLIVLVLSIYSYQVFAAQQAVPDNELTIQVKGQQFVWSFTYPKSDPKLNMRSTSELHLPVNVPIHMLITSTDVMHGFWVPEFRVKQDAVPGRVTEVRFTPTQMGEYAVVCYELCGNGHGTMRMPVFVESQDDYDAYVKSLIIVPPTKPKPGNHNADWGKYLVVSNVYGCAGCHALADAGINGQTGPAWTNIADIAPKQVPGQDARTRLTHAILYPNEYIYPGYPANVMPQNFGQRMDDVDLNSIVDYLLQQTTNPSGTAAGTPTPTVTP
ncbi:MAG: cytochrome c oxidase subunit II [Aggregatilineales bacterium]